MAVTWPDGSVTGSVRVETPALAPVKPEPEKSTADADAPPEKKEVKDADR